MKTLRILVFPVIIVIMFSSCTQVIKNSADEIRLNKWYVSLKNGSNISLKFNDDIAIFKVESKDKNACLRLKGVCFIDSKNILIYDEGDKQNYIFEYILKENKLKLTYNNASICLKRR